MVTEITMPHILIFGYINRASVQIHPLKDIMCLCGNPTGGNTQDHTRQILSHFCVAVSKELRYMKRNHTCVAVSKE